MENTALRTATNSDHSSLLKQALLIVGASAVIAVCARLVIPLPFTPVPLTLANFGVLLVGLALGSRRGFAAAALYLLWGGIGLPVFAGGLAGLAYFHSATAGYLLAYPVVAFIAGWLSEHGPATFVRNLLSATIAELVLFASGLGWLAVVTHSWQRAALFGLYPFLFAEVMKVMVASAGALRLRRTW